MVVGAYQFFRPSQDATVQAALMVDQLQGVGFGAGDMEIEHSTPSASPYPTLVGDSHFRTFIRPTRLRAGAR